MFAAFHTVWQSSWSMLWLLTRQQDWLLASLAAFGTFSGLPSKTCWKVHLHGAPAWGTCMGHLLNLTAAKQMYLEGAPPHHGTDGYAICNQSS